MMKKRQNGFALFISMIFMIILTFIGFGFANKGKLTSQVAKTSSRYEAVSAAAEDEMYRLLGLLARSEGYIKTGDGVTDNGKALTQVWANVELADNFNGEKRGLPVFSDFNNAGWRDGPITQTINSEYGQISTQGFVQELIKRVNPTGSEVTVQYLITVKAFSQNPGEESSTTERESIAIQSLSEMQFVGESL